MHKLTHDEISQVLYIRNQLEVRACDAMIVDDTEFFDPEVSYKAIDIQFKSSQHTSVELTTIVFETILDPLYSDYFYSKQLFNVFKESLGTCFCEVNLSGNLRLFRFLLQFKALLQGLPHGRIRDAMDYDIKQVLSFLKHKLDTPKFSFKEKKNQIQFTQCVSVLNALTENNQTLEAFAKALTVLSSYLDRPDTECTDWFVTFNLFYSDFLSAWIKEPTEQTKNYFALQTQYGIFKNDRYVDMPYFFNRMFGILVTHLTKCPVNNEKEMADFIKLANEAIANRKALNQKFKN